MEASIDTARRRQEAGASVAGQPAPGTVMPVQWEGPWYDPWREVGKAVLRNVETGAPLWDALNCAGYAPVRFVAHGELPGGMKEYASLINHMHFKDWNGEPEFTLMGNGKVDLLGITQWLKDRDYKGWIICEDEGAEAMEDPDFVTLHDGRWVTETLIKGLK